MEKETKGKTFTSVAQGKRIPYKKPSEKVPEQLKPVLNQNESYVYKSINQQHPVSRWWEGDANGQSVTLSNVLDGRLDLLVSY